MIFTIITIIFAIILVVLAAISVEQKDIVRSLIFLTPIIFAPLSVIAGKTRRALTAPT